MMKDEDLCELIDNILDGDTHAFFSRDGWCVKLDWYSISLKRAGELEWHTESFKNGIANALDNFDEIECAVVFGGEFDNMYDFLRNYG